MLKRAFHLEVFDLGTSVVYRIYFFYSFHVQVVSIFYRKCYTITVVLITVGFFSFKKSYAQV